MADPEQHAHGNGAAPGAAAAPPIPALSDDKGVPPHLVTLAVVVGMIFTAAGGWFAVQASANTYGVHIAVLIACSGLALTLVALGGKTVGTWRSWSFAGAAATAPLLFVLQWQLQPTPDAGYVRGELEGTGRFQQITIWGHDSPLYVRKPNTAQNFQFVAFDRQISETGRFFVVVVNEHGKSPETFTIYCLEGELFRKHKRGSTPIQLAIRSGPPASGNPTWFLYGSDNKQLGKFNDSDCDSGAEKQSITQRPPTSPREPNQRTSPSVPVSLIGSAYAQSPSPISDLERLFKSLSSESSDQRVGSRVELSKITKADLLRPVMGLWNTASSSYREDLGLITAWNTAISNDRAAAVPIAEALTPVQLNYLVALSGHPDQTMRYGATKLISWFLQASAWPNGVRADRAQAIVEAVRRGLAEPAAVTTRRDVHFQPESTVANLLVAIDWSNCSIARFDRPKTLDVLKAIQESPGSSENTRSLAKKVSERLMKCPTFSFEQLKQRLPNPTGSPVFSVERKQIGKVDRFLVDDDGVIIAVVVESGGIAGIGDRERVVAGYRIESAGSPAGIVLQLSEKEITGLPQYRSERLKQYEADLNEKRPLKIVN
jgi:hypothetical protein